MLSKIFDKFKSTEEFKPSSEPVNGKITYNLQCGTAHQEELDIEQDEKLTEVLMGFDVNALSFENTTIKDLIQRVVNEKAVYKILSIILFSEDKDFDVRYIKNSELEMIISDFFSLNPTAINWLKTIGGALISMSQTKSTSSSESP
jgi:hypothetical protein